MKIDLVATVFIFSDNKLLLVRHKKLGLWLPVGGHIEENETPDDTIKREAKEETNLEIEILNQSDMPPAGNVTGELATPFYVNVHNVGDHEHCSFFYVARALNPEEIKINNELTDCRWFSRAELDEDIVPVDVRNQAGRAFKIFEDCGTPNA